MRRTFVASQAVSDAPAIYFVKPTDENVERMAADIKKGLYRTLGTHVGRSIYVRRHSATVTHAMQRRTHLAGQARRFLVA